jgi:hypothetical protein
MCEEALMSKTGVENDLLRDVERYSRGEVPSMLEMLGATIIDRWEPRIETRADGFALRLRGRVQRHPGYADGHDVVTSPIVWMDRKARFARTIGRLYVLGDPGGEDTETQHEEAW